MSMTKEQLISLIDGIATNEKFKLDAFFFCGFPTEKPNENLMRACTAYIDSINNDTESEEIRDNLVKELQAVLDSVPEVKGAKNILSNEAEIRKILENKELL